MILSNKFDYKTKVCLLSDKIILFTKPYIVKMLHNETFRTPINPLFYEEKINFNTKIKDKILTKLNPIYFLKLQK